MKPYLVKMPKLVQRIFPKRVWAFTENTSAVYLTFDDGPIPEVTPWLLRELNKHKAKATFFCIGENIRKHPKIFKSLISEGHSIGNHTYHHLNGSQTKVSEYIENVHLSQAEANNQSSVNNNQFLFRPPYGRITSKQSKILQDQGYKIIMWDVLSADFDPKVSEKKCLQNVIKNIEPGSIVVFHDSLKAENNLRYSLPKVLEYINKKGWKCEAIS
jgi:peptidoglycan/xylan/chitin deacetylase (PgdA/CDA1 family)